MKLPQHIQNPNPDIYMSENYIVFDVETTNLEKGDCLVADNKLLIITYKLPNSDKVEIAHWNEFQIPSWFFDAMESCDFIVAHNAKFDLGWMARAGLSLEKIVVWDTQIAEYVLAGNRKMKLSLDASLQRHGRSSKNGYINRMIRAGVCPSELPDSMLDYYAIKDTEETHQLFLSQRQMIANKNLTRTMYTHCLFTPVLTDIETKGMQLDIERVSIVYNKVKEEYDDLVSDFNRIADNINFNSSVQVAEFLYDKLGFEEPKDRKGNPIRTAAGKRKADKSTIESLKAKTKEQKEFIALKRKLSDLTAKLDKALKNFMLCCEENEGLLYGQFNQTITQTHRLSSNGKKYKVQFQNMFREFKPLFCAKKDGWLIGETDGAQLEFRIAAFYGQDQQASDDINAGSDVHQFTADTLTAAGQKTDRQGAKAHTFKPLFGGMSGTKAEVTYYKAFRDKYPGITSKQDSWLTEVLKTDQLTLPTGMIFYWPNTTMSRSGYIDNTTAISNYPIQYLATGEIIPISVVYLWHRLKACNAKTCIVNTIHDSVIAEVCPEEQELYKQLSVQSFTDDVYSYLDKVYGIDFNIKLEVDIKLSSHWADNLKWRNKWLGEENECS